MLRAAILVASLIVGTAPAFAQWADWPPGPTDAELERVVRVAYAAAAAHARTDNNYFARDEVFTPLRDAVATGLAEQGLLEVIVTDSPTVDLEASLGCAVERGIELRISVTIFGDGISLAAVTDKRAFAYAYDPHQNAAIVVTPAGDCETR